MSAIQPETHRSYKEKAAAAATEFSAFHYSDLKWRTSCDPQLRILHLLPASKSKEAIVCRLTTTYAGDKPSYEALSYSWGDFQDRRQITLNGYNFPVTSNLYCALRHLRYADKERRLWVDAICLNQNNMREKSVMVQRMHLVYDQANRTLVWLGDEGSDTGIAWNIFSLVGREGALYSSPAIKNDLEKLLLPQQENIQKTIEGWEALANFFGRDYWTRTWIVQEIVCSTNVQVVCGTRTASFDCIRLTTVMVHPLINKSIDILSGPKWVGLRGMKLVGHLCDIHYCLQTRNPKPLGSILSDLRESRATDPRDKVYGCIALAELPPSLGVRYDLSPAEVFTNVARALIEHDKSLRLLSSCDEHDRDPNSPGYKTTFCEFKGHDIPDLPSWVPNWGRIRLTNPLPGDYGFDFKHPYRASAASKAWYKFSKDDVSLSVKGILVDKSFKVGVDVYGIGDERDIFQDALEIYCKHPVSCSKHASEIGDILVHTLTANRQPSGDKFPRNFVPNIENVRDPMINGNIPKTTAGRVFFITEQGLIGLGPQKMRVGDCICIISGCHVPIVLRQVRKSSGLFNVRANSSNFSCEDTLHYYVVGPACKFSI